MRNVIIHYEFAGLPKELTPFCRGLRYEIRFPFVTDFTRIAMRNRT
jgi:hypothetical protein